VQGIDLLGDNGGNASPVRRSPSLTSFMPTNEACAETTTCPSIDSLSVRLDHFLNTRRGVVISPMPMSTSSQLAAPYSFSVVCIALLLGGTSTTL
jgi:hypothetical protein